MFEESLLIVSAAILETVIFGALLNERGMRFIRWILDNVTWQDVFVWINPIFFFISHLFVYGTSLDTILLAGNYAIQLHVVSQLIVFYMARSNFEKHVLPQIRKRIKEHTILVGEPHYSSLEWMMCNQ